ncbi:acetyl-CoA synthetase-like protein [Aureobasidium pullulans]|nr:acetyl-CoA synthetase-like protein [Aureobasidium pullulans]
MVYLPSEYREVPPVDLLSWLFDNTGVDVEKDILYPILYFGTIGSGGIFVGSNPSYKVTELGHLISIAQPKYAIIEAGLLTKISAALKASISAEQIFVFDPHAGQTIQKELKCWTSLLQYGEQDWIRFDEEAISKSTIAVLQSTSGTTGLPKVAATSHYALVAAGVAMQCSRPKPYAVSRLISLPLFHSFGASFVQNSAFQSGEPTVMDSHGFEILDEGVAGELQVRGPSTMNGYSRFHDATTGVSTADWLRTGDLGCVKRGNVYILGRMKELIKVRGWQVSPTELEQTLLLHESILDAAVIGVRFPTREFDGELPRAYVVIREGGFGIDEQEVQKFVRDRLASFKALDGGVVFVETIQRNAYGKIMRQPLMERAMAEITTNMTEARI